MLLRCGLLMARTHINGRRLAYRSARICSATELVLTLTPLGLSRAGMCTTWGGVPQRGETCRGSTVKGETEGPQPQSVSDIPSISTLYSKISLNLLLASTAYPSHPRIHKARMHSSPVYEDGIFTGATRREGPTTDKDAA